jgi:endonuclease G, mitochondrial
MRYRKLRSNLAFCLLGLLLACLTPLACGPKQPPPDGSPTTGSPNAGSAVTDESYKLSPHLGLGNPSGANESDKNNYLILRNEYALSYNDDAGHPNWVSWHLRAEDLGPIERGTFAPDVNLPDGFTQVTPRDYTKSGYDRGHLCPSGDRTASASANDATFLMTNIFPQAPGNNRGPWKNLEEASRDLVQSGLHLYIIAGGGGQKNKSIGRGKVDVPVFTWKVIVALPEGKQAPQDINETTRIIAVKMPNISTISNKDWREFRVSPREIENETGYKFLTTVPSGIRESLLNRVDVDAQ